MVEHGGHNEHLENVQQDDNALQGGEGQELLETNAQPIPSPLPPTFFVKWKFSMVWQGMYRAQTKN